MQITKSSSFHKYSAAQILQYLFTIICLIVLLGLLS